jgi:glycosyltransferase involved in cell wall biosynthesis
MGEASLITVIIPVYNRSSILPRAIESVQKQHFQQWTLLIVDDGSTDDTIAVAQQYERDARVRVLQMPRNGGAAAARNFGIRSASSPYIALLDSDDMYHPDFLQYSMDALSRAEASIGFSYTGVGVLQQSDMGTATSAQVWKLPEQYKSHKRPYLYQLQVGTAAGILLRREVFDKVGFFDEQLRAAEDTDWFIRASEFYQGLPVPYTLIFKDNLVAERLTTNYKRNAEAYASIIHKNQELIEASAFLTHRWYYKAMWLNFYSGEKSIARQYYEKLKQKQLASMKTSFTYAAGMLLPLSWFIGLHKKLASLK